MKCQHSSKPWTLAVIFRGTSKHTSMTVLKFLFFFTLVFIIHPFSFGQNGKFYFITDKDTIRNNSNEVKVFIEMANGDSIQFNRHDSLLYPLNINTDSINSIIVIYRSKKLSFYNFKDKVKYSRLPLEVIKVQQPHYSKIFADKRNLYFTVDNYPFESIDREESAKMDLDYAKVPLKKIIVVELFYQVREMFVLNDKGK